MTSLMLRDVELDGVPGSAVVIRDGVIAEVGIGLEPAENTDVIDGGGGALVPGLHDHHIHLHATAAERLSVRCGPPQVRNADDLARVLRAAPGDSVRGVGYFESVAGELDSEALDLMHAQRPVRVQHRSGALWVLNSAAAALARLDTADHPGVERYGDGRPTGRVWRADTWLRDRLPPTAPPPLDAIGAQLAAYGVTGLTDATPDLSPSSLTALADAHVVGALPQRLHLLGAPSGFVSPSGTLTSGPYKIVLADSGLPDLHALAETIRSVHAAGRGVAVHCVSREAFAILLAAFTEVGARPGDRIEHGALIPPESIDDLRLLGLRVVSQPGFLADRGDSYLRDVDPRDLGDLYRCRSLLDAGVPLALSSDAPYGPLDPWQIIEAATTRTTESGAVLGHPEILDPSQALAGFLSAADDPGGQPRTIRIGRPGDVVLLHAPLADVLAAPSSSAVRATVIGGRVVHG
ncbi:amidohydrolase family protein [Rhodococcus sp. (in: high G+C Gram-positive bacteria)]|uniref:amidohydrolase family protein n=1 Tax=Rhodococcus sp. TaxID=1831 RepID=UPI00388D1AC5